MKKVLKKLPIPICGLMLGLAACGNLVLSYGNIYRNIFGVLSAIILVFLIAKIAVDSKSLAEALNNPVVCSVIPTFSMAVMLLSAYIKPFVPKLALIVWIAGLLLHAVLIVYFTIKYMLKFDIKKVFPSYFIVYVGIVAASVTAPTFNLQSLGKVIFWFGLITYIILLPIVIYRVFKVKGIPEPAMPTIAIFAAPASLCLAGYISSFKVKSMGLVIFLLCLALIMTLSVLLYLPKLLELKFYPSYSSFTFPLVISGIAVKLANGFLSQNKINIQIFKYVIKFEELLAVVMVLYVLVRYIGFIFSKAHVSASKSIKA